MRLERFKFFFLFLLVVLTRVPFLGRGFGVEEDAWGTAVAIRNTLSTGVFETSRLPGHPVNELFYLLLWPADSWWFNFCSAICSGVFAVIFLRILLDAGLPKFKSFLASFACCMVPAIYVSSTCTMDYIWGLMFMTLSWHSINRQWLISAGVFLGLAVGCRITMAGMFFPLIFLIYARQIEPRKEILRFSFSCFVTSILVFLPVMEVYGPGFFTYSDQFPYPPWPKVLYKLSIGVWGLMGLMGLVLGFLSFGTRVGQVLKSEKGIFTMITLFVYTLGYFILPQKSAYMIAVIPAVIFLFAHHSDLRFFIPVSLLFILSSLMLGVNLSDPYRGAEQESAIFQTRVSGQEIFVDFAGGAITHDFSKRKRKNEYCLGVMKRLNQLPGSKSVICGWWYNQILIYSDWYGSPHDTNWLFYSDTVTLHRSLDAGDAVYYLSEQDVYNDLMFPPSKRLRKERKALIFPDK